MSRKTEARSAHVRLRDALAALREAERNAVALFADILRRKLYRELGYASIHLYAAQALGFSRTKTYEFIRLAESLEKLPRLKQRVESGEVPWTKAREVVKVATPETESEWLELAESRSRRELEHEVVKSRAARDRDDSQGELVPLPPTPKAAATPYVTFRLEAMSKAKLEAMIEKLMKLHHCSREQVLMMALEAFNGSGGESSPRGDAPYQVIVHRCEECGKSQVGETELSGAEAERVACDSRVLEPGKRNRASIPPARRRAVLARDGHRCTTKGCNAKHFLEVHHVVPRSRGGSNDEANLVTLCSACHRFAHQRVVSPELSPRGDSITGEGSPPAAIGGPIRPAERRRRGTRPPWP